MSLPDPKEFCALWRELAERAGLPGLHLIGFGARGWGPTQWGFDASVQHSPRIPRRFRSLWGLGARLLRLRGRRGGLQIAEVSAGLHRDCVKSAGKVRRAVRRWE